MVFRLAVFQFISPFSLSPLLPVFFLWCRLLHSLNLVAIGLSVGYKTWPPCGWHHPLVIGWSKYRLGLPSAPLHYGLTWPVGILTVFSDLSDSPFHSLNLPAVRAVQEDCERVYGWWGCPGSPYFRSLCIHLAELGGSRAVGDKLWRHCQATYSTTMACTKAPAGNQARVYYQDLGAGFNIKMGQVMELWLSCYLVLLSVDSKTR